MLMSILAYAVAVWLLLVGLYGAATSRNLIHLVMCFTIIQSSTYVLLLAIGFHTGGHPPILETAAKAKGAVDPVVQAMALTDIVVGATVTAMLLVMVVQIHKRKHTLDPDELRPLEQSE